jgi:hypothetical protein
MALLASGGGVPSIGIPERPLCKARFSLTIFETENKMNLFTRAKEIL